LLITYIVNIKELKMIPKIIHYCWFGNSPIPNQFAAYINQWKTLLPDYKLKKWSEENFQISNAPLYVREAYKCKKFAFVADYVRLYALYSEGGIYLDTDVWVRKRFDDYLNDGFFSSIEYHKDMVNSLDIIKNDLNSDYTRKENVEHIRGIGIQSAIFGGEKGTEYLKYCLDFYKNKSFIIQNDNYYDKIILPDILALCAEKYGFKYIEDEQYLDKNIHIYPQDIFTGLNNVTDKSVAVHCAHNSWRNKSFLQRVSIYLSQHCWGNKLKELLEIVGLRSYIRRIVWFK